MLDNQFFPGAGGERSLSLVIVARLFEPARGTVKYIHTHKINEKRVSLMYSIYSINKRISMQSRLCLSLFFLLARHGVTANIVARWFESARAWFVHKYTQDK